MPSAPTIVVMTVLPRAIDSMILMRMPLPESKGTMATSWLATNSLASATSPMTSRCLLSLFFNQSGMLRPARWKTKSGTLAVTASRQSSMNHRIPSTLGIQFMDPI